MKKKALSIILLLIIFIQFNSTIVYANNFEYIVPNVWPGRPGGNGDGSEEYLSGKYGEMNGPYRYIWETRGTVENLNRSKNVVSTLLTTSIGLFESNKITGALIGSLGTLSSFKKNYEGVTYISKSYVSGRRLKFVIQTYRDYNMKRPLKKYIEIRKW